MKASEILKTISELDDQEMWLFLDFLRMGFENEWDCNLDSIENYGPQEVKIAVKEAASLASMWEKK